MTTGSRTKKNDRGQNRILWIYAAFGGCIDLFYRAIGDMSNAKLMTERAILPPKPTDTEQTHSMHSRKSTVQTGPATGSPLPKTK